MKSHFLSLFLLSLPAVAADWPMWRFDAGRTAASDEVLPGSMHLQWERVETPREQVWDDPLNHDLMPYDRIFEPVVMGGKMFIGYNDRDKVVAVDLETGDEVWTFFTGAPVRLAPVCWQTGMVFHGGPLGPQSDWKPPSDLGLASAGWPGHQRWEALLCSQHLALHGDLYLLPGRCDRQSGVGK
jgi:hypothetical protein